jgi:hypothetical protein
MMERALDHGARVQLNRSYFDTSILKGLCRRNSDDVIRVAYPTGRVDDDELEERIFSAVRMILQKYDAKVEFHLWRKSVPRQLSGVKGVVLNKGVRGYDKFIRSFFRTGFDIGLAPGIDTPFFHSKTNNKYREFGGCGIAGIYSNFPPYSNSVTHEHTGLLAGSSIEEWASAIERLVLDDKLRAHIADNAAEDVFSHYSFESAVESWQECFRLLKDHKSELPEWIPLPDQAPIFASVNLSPANGTDRPDRRYEYLRLSIVSLHRSYLEQLSALEYLRSSIKRSFAASIFFLSNEKELQTLSALLPLSTSAIVDMTTYHNDVDGAISHLRGATSRVPMTFLLSPEQAKMSALSTIMPECVLLDEIDPSSIAQEFSLAGYPAAYLDLAERHICFGPIRSRSRLARLRAVPYVIADRYTRWKGRLETVFMWIKWRIGFRQC